MFHTAARACDNTCGFYVNSLQSARHYRTGGSSFTPAMPRIRGRPRRGAAGTQLLLGGSDIKGFPKQFAWPGRKCRATAAATLSPPGTLVEEDLSITLPADFLESRMFLVPDDWDPPTCFGRSPSPHTPSILPQPPIDPNANYPVCIVMEEALDNTMGEQTKEHRRAEREQGPSQDAPELERSLPPSPQLLHPEHLRLIFEVRSLMDDQAFSAMRLSQRLDMLYAAYSKATPRRQCPTCAQPFVFPGNGGNPD
jgi:hypothetical protein